MSDQDLTDHQLKETGFQSVQAYVLKRPNKNAERQKRYRKKKEAEGFKQTNVLVPEEHQETIREIARRLREGEPLEGLSVPKPAQNTKEKPEPAAPAKPTAPQVVDPGALTEVERKVQAVGRGEGIRGRLIRRLARGT